MRSYAITMPLPPIEEQRRIVGRIERLGKHVKAGLTGAENATSNSPALTRPWRVLIVLTGTIEWISHGDDLDDAKNGLWETSGYSRGRVLMRQKVEY